MNTNVALPLDVSAELFKHAREKTTDRADSKLIVPSEHFVSQERADAEIALMRRLPLIIGHVAEIPNTGDFITRKVLETPILAVRQASGEVAVFRNMCRHRGGIVEQARSGNKHAFMCQYHGWIYDAEGGGLKRVLYEDSFGKIDYDCSGLFRLKTEVRHGFIFVTLEPQEGAEDLAQYLGEGVDAQIAPWRLDGATIVLGHTVTRAMNWKLVMDGAIDPLHPPYLHSTPGGVGDRALHNTSVFRTYGRHGKMFGPRHKFRNLLDEGGTPADVTTRHVGTVMVIYPNSLFVEAPDHVEFWTVWPTVGKPGECTVDIKFLARPEILTPEMTARVHKSWAILEHAALNEDFPMEMAIQENAQAYSEARFTYGRNEKPGQHLHRQLARDLGREDELSNA